MKLLLAERVFVACLLFAALATPHRVLAQAYPAKSVRMVVPYAAGGATDTVARAMGNRLSETLGQSVVIDNRGGATGTIGADIVAKAAPDGYTLLLTVGPPHGSYPFFMKSVPFDTLKDFTPITLVGTAPQAVVVHPSVPVHSIKELIEYTKKKSRQGVVCHCGRRLVAAHRRRTAQPHRRHRHGARGLQGRGARTE